MNRHSLAISQTLVMIIASAFAGVLAKLALNDVPPFTFVWLQIAIGGTLLTFYTFQLRGETIPKKLDCRIWIYFAGIGIGNFTIVRVLFMLSLERLPVTTHVYLVNFVGIITMLMSSLILKERPSFLQIIGAILAISGLHVFFKEIPPPYELIGVLYVAIGILALAFTNNIARKLAQITKNELSNNIISTVAFWIGGLPVILAGIIFDWPPPVSGLRDWGIIFFNAIIGIAIGLTVFNYILRTLRSYEASILATSGLIFTAIFAIPILGEYLEFHQITGITMMLIGISIVQIRRRNLAK